MQNPAYAEAEYDTANCSEVKPTLVMHRTKGVELESELNQLYRRGV